MVVGGLPRRVCPDQSNDGCSQQEEAADALNVDELLDRHYQCAGHQRLAQLNLKRSVGARWDTHGSKPLLSITSALTIQLIRRTIVNDERFCIGNPEALGYAERLHVR